MNVVDISAWQSDDDGHTKVDWDGLVTAGVDGVIIKIGEHSTLDVGFIDHVNAAVAHGLKYGIYYYAHACNEAEAQREAAQVDAWVKEYLNGTCPELGIWYDAESNRMLSEGDDITGVCSAFVSYLNGIGYIYVGIYASWNWLSAQGAHYIHIEDLADYVPYWVAQYNSHDDLSDEYPDNNIRIWQYSDHLSDELPYDADLYYEY